MLHKSVYIAFSEDASGCRIMAENNYLLKVTYSRSCIMMAWALVINFNFKNPQMIKNDWEKCKIKSTLMVV